MAVNRDSKTDEYLGLKCDTCSRVSPPIDDIMRAFGLVNLGWYCSGGTHICGDCPHPPVVKVRNER